jgi:hypothetical protein
MGKADGAEEIVIFVGPAMERPMASAFIHMPARHSSDKTLYFAASTHNIS